MEEKDMRSGLIPLLIWPATPKCDRGNNGVKNIANSHSRKSQYVLSSAI